MKLLSQSPASYRSWLVLGVTLATVDAFFQSTHKDFLATKPTRAPPFAILSSTQGVDNDASNAAAVEITKKKSQLSRPERKALERQKKLQPQRSKPPKYELHSNAISRLTKNSTAEEITRAIKRAQNNHDHQDLKVIADFLIEECDVGFAYGYRGSLLARLAVAALHFDNHQVARRAIDIRRQGTCIRHI